jgi:hypothetical protein
MKILISFLIAAFVSYSAFAQEVTSVNMPVDETTGLITYKEVIEESGTKDELFNRGSSWLHDFYVNPWEVAKVRDQSTGLIKIQHQFRIYDQDKDSNKIDAGLILYNAKLEFKEGRYRIVVDNFVLKGLSRYPVEKWLDVTAPEYDVKWKNYLSQINSYVTGELIKSLKDAMKPAKAAEEDIW